MPWSTDPHWRDNVAKALAARRERATTTKRGAVLRAGSSPHLLVHHHIMIDARMLAALDEAAEKRGVNRSTYTRRTLAVMIAADSDMDVGFMLALCPPAVAWGEHTQRLANRGGTDTEESMGTWCPHPGCEGHTA